MTFARSVGSALAGLLVMVSLVASPEGTTPAYASSKTMSAPAGSTATPGESHDPGDFVVSGFEPTDSLLVSIGFVGAPAGTTFSLSQTTGLTPAAGYTATWTGLDRVSFISSQANANAALASMTVVAGNNLGDFQVRVSATLNEEGLVYNPKNDHFYLHVNQNKTWSDAFAHASTLTKKGATGYLATITSPDESKFIAANVTTATRLWVAGAQVKGETIGSTASDAVWKWVAGPENGTTFWTKTNSGTGGGVTVGDVTVYANWCSGEPNNTSEPYLVIRWQLSGDTECWNDYGSNNETTTFIVEFDPSGLDNGYQDVYTGLTTITVNYPITNVAVEAGNAQVTASWTAPSGGTVTGYTVTAIPGGQSCTALPTETFCTVVDLTNGTEYVFDIVAAFDGTDSTSVARTPAATPIDSAPGLTGPGSIAAAVSSPTTLGSFTISDPFNCGWGEMTATMTASSGTVSSSASGSAVVTGSGTATLTVRGSIADVAATISGATFVSSQVGNFTVTTSVVPSVDFTAPDSKRYHLNADTGHYYLVLTAADFGASGTAVQQQDQAAAFARNLTFCGFRGYLVAVDDSDEQSFIETSGAFDAISPKISLYSSGRKTGGTWQWEPGNGAPAGQYPKNFFDQGATQGSGPWHDNEPNNSGSTHAFWFTDNRYGWDDIGGSPSNYGALVEFGATTLFTTPAVTTTVAVSNDPTQLVVSTQPVGGETGATLTTAPVVQVRGASNQIVTDATDSISVTIHSGTGGTLGGTTTVSAVAGQATFSGLTLTGTVGEPYVLRFTGGGFTVDSSPIFLSPSVSAPADHLVSITDSLQAFVVSGLTQAQVTITLSGGVSAGATLEVPLAQRSGLTLASGITSWEGRELSFRGSQDAVNAALANLILRSSDTGDVTITVEAVDVSSGSSVNYFPGNGSFYEYVAQSGVSYSAAKTAAGNKTFAGRTGHLVTITSQAEQDFVSGRIQGATNIWIAATDSGKEGVWYWDAGPEQNKVLWRSTHKVDGVDCVTRPGDEVDALFTDYSSNCPATSSYTNAGVATATFNFAKWCSGEPNNSDGSRGEHHAVTNWNSGTCWNDLNGNNTSSIGGYVVEYSDPSGGGGGGSSGIGRASTTVTVGNKISIQAGGSQTAAVGTELTTSPTVTVLDGSDAPIAGATVIFTVVTGGGSVAAASVTTDADGSASTSWTLGTSSGSQSLRATLSGDGGLASNVTFTATATAGPATQISIFSGNNQSRVAGSAVTTAPTVIVRDQFANPVSGVTVEFSVVLGGGSATGTTRTTDANGRAQVGSWTLGTQTGQNTLSATASGLSGSPITFTAQATSGTASALGLATAPVLGASGAVMTTQPVVEIRDANGNLVTTATNTVTVTILSGIGGDIEGSETVTAVGGVATFTELAFRGLVGQPYILQFSTTGLTAVQTEALRIVAPPPAPVTPTPAPRPQAPVVDSLVTDATTSTVRPGLPPGRTPAPGTAPAPLAGPLPGVSGNGGQVPQAPTALIGGRLAPVNTNVVNQNQVNLQTGGSSFGVSIPQGQGSVAAQGGNTELAVQFGAQTRLSGSGLFPGSTVQVFMPLGPNGSREIAQLPVGPSGAFDGDATFTTRPTDPPLPVGRNVLQIASLNEAGERVIVEMAINIAQSAPAPEILRTNGEIPGLTPGESLATRAGEPVDVRLTVDSTSRLTTVEGNGWSLAIDVDSDGNVVEETPDGGALISVVRGGEAKVQGTGFMPLTRADIWLFSDPTLLGSVDIDENGEFNGTVIVDGRVVPVGDHTLQIQGVGVDGFVLAANLGVVVSDPDQESTATTEQAAAGVLWWVVALIALLVVAVVVWSVVRRRTSGGEAEK